MFTVMTLKHFKRQAIVLGQMWAHIDAENAVKHAEARQRFDGEIYVVLYGGKQIYSTERCG